MPVAKEIGLKVREARKKKGLTQAELAELIHMSDQYISKIEVGDTNITIELLFSIAEALEEDFLYFVSSDIFQKHSKETYQLLHKFSSLNQNNKFIIDSLIEILNNQPNQ